MPNMSSMGGGDKKYTTNKVNTKNYTAVYRPDQNKQMSKSSEFGDDNRAKAAAIKKDLGNDKLKRAPYGSKVAQESAHKSLENQVKKTEANMSGGGSAPVNNAAKEATIKGEKTVADKYAEKDDVKESARTEATKKAEAKNPTFTYKKNYIKPENMARNGLK